MPKKNSSVRAQQTADVMQEGIIDGQAPVLPAKPAPEKPLRTKSKWWIPLIIIFILLYGAFNVGVYIYSIDTRQLGSKLINLVHPPATTPTPIPSPTPTPRPIPHGPMNFTSSQSDTTVPQLREGHIDPYDPARGTTQTVTITVKHTAPVTNVTAVLKTDHTKTPSIPFTLISGTATDGTWKGSWQVTDSYLYTYILELRATSGTKTGTVGITLR
jgi:hypothetical protein